MEGCGLHSSGTG